MALWLKLPALNGGVAEGAKGPLAGGGSRLETSGRKRVAPVPQHLFRTVLTQMLPHPLFGWHLFRVLLCLCGGDWNPLHHALRRLFLGKPGNPPPVDAWANSSR